MEEEAGVWVRLLDDRILTPSQFNALTAEDCKTRVQFVPVPFDNEDIGERIDDLQHGEEHIPLSHRVSVVGDGDMSFTVLDKRTNHYVSKEEMLSNDGPYGPPGDARRSDLVFWGYPCDLIDDKQGIESVHESARLLELDQLIVTQLRRRIYEWPPPPIAPTRALIDAVDALDGARIRDVLECDGPFKITHDFFAAVLLRSLPRGRTNVMAVKALLDAGVDDLTSPVDDNNPQWAVEDITPGATPFFAACTYGRLDCALLILERERAMARARADATPILSLDVPLQSGATPLHFCCQNGAELTARFLIAQRADLSKTRGTGGGPLFAACQNGFPRLVAILLAAKASVDHGMRRTGTTPLMAACMTGKTETVEMLLEAGADVTAVALDGHTAHSLTKAAGAQHAAGQRGISEAEEIAVTRLLEEGVSEPKLHVGDRVLISGLRGRPDLNGLGAVVHSYLQERGRYRVEVEQLDEAVALKRQNIELIPGLPFMEPRDFNMLLFNGQAYACEVFVRNGHVSKLALDAIYVGRTGTEGSLLVHASLCLTSGRADLVKALLDANANACGTNIGRSATPLMAACQFGRLEVVEMLLAHGAAATIDADNAVSGLPPALMQCFIIGERAAHMDINRDESKLLDCARMLIAHGADISRVDSAGYSNLMAAAQWGNEGAVRLLLEKRAEVNYSNACEGPGFSALMAALAEGHVECVRALIDAGADTTLTWSGGSSGTSVPLDAQGIAKLRRSHRTTLWGPVRYDLCLEALTEFDRFTEKALALGVLGENGVDTLTDRIAKGESQRTIINEFEPAMQRAERSDMISGLRMRRLARTRFAKYEQDRSAGLPTANLYPKQGDDDCNVGGGLARVVGLEKRPELNGEIGRISSFNVDGRRRFAIRLVTSGKVLSLHPGNLTPVDNPALEYPTRCTASSVSIVSELQRELEAVGIDKVVHDWTTLTEDPEVDMPNLYYQGLWSNTVSELEDTLFYVQRTGKNETFFLCHREFMNGDQGSIYRGQSMNGQMCVPWMLFKSPGNITIPPFSDQVCNTGFMARLLKIGASSRIECSVCLKMVKTQQNPSQLPCIHFLCTDCLKKLFPLDKKGLTCPSCKTMFPGYLLSAHPTVPGCVALMEHCASAHDPQLY